jgi:hypothetical protein
VGNGGSSPGVERPGREADDSNSSSAEIKNDWNYISTLPIRLHGVMLKRVMDFFMPWYLAKHRENLTFTFYVHIRGCNQKIPDWPSGARNVNSRALCH